ncbi:hypothetical protein BDR03DRAFT_954901 [Suillus americanus]|nr:hypothetical protein BDR03DRAFT_954901 [Suillus americanus]
MHGTYHRSRTSLPCSLANPSSSVTFCHSFAALTPIRPNSSDLKGGPSFLVAAFLLLTLLQCGTNRHFLLLGGRIDHLNCRHDCRLRSLMGYFTLNVTALCRAFHMYKQELLSK